MGTLKRLLQGRRSWESDCPPRGGALAGTSKKRYGKEGGPGRVTVLLEVEHWLERVKNVMARKAVLGE